MLFLNLNFGAKYAPTIPVKQNNENYNIQTLEHLNDLTTMKSFIDKNMTRKNAGT